MKQKPALDKKENKITINDIISWGLIIILIITVIWAKNSGTYDKTEIKITCEELAYIENLPEEQQEQEIQRIIQKYKIEETKEKWTKNQN